MSGSVRPAYDFLCPQASAGCGWRVVRPATGSLITWRGRRSLKPALLVLISWSSDAR